HETGVLPDRGDTAAEQQRAGRYAHGNRLGRTSSSGAARPAIDARTGSRPECAGRVRRGRSEEHTSELQSRENLVCRLLLEKKKSGRVDGALWKRSDPDTTDGA